MEEKSVKCPKCHTTYNKMFLMGKQGNIDTCPMCGSDMNDEEHPDWITWYYYKDPQYGDYSLWDKLPLKPEDLVLIKEFKAPPKDANGNCEAAKRELRKYVPDAFAQPKENPIRCPRCLSTEYTLMNRGFSIFTGFFGSGNVKRVCNRCQREF